MKTVLFILWLAFGTLAMPAHAGYEEGAIAFNDKVYTIAYREFLAPAKQGDSRAQNALGVLHENGWGVPKDLRAAFEWYVLAANQGSAMAQFNLAGMYKAGKGVDLNLQEAFRLYRLSAEQGLVGAQRNLGFFYVTGQGVLQNHQEAVRWYRLAADQGDAEAQYRLGLQYHQGHGAPRDIAEARKWYQLAVRQGHNDAKKWLLVAEQQLETPANRDAAEADSGNDKKPLRPWAPPGAIMQGCGCWQPGGRPDIRCMSGSVRSAPCPGTCPFGQPVSYICD